MASGGPSSWWVCQWAAWVQAVSRAQAPMGTIRPVSSARPMSLKGARRPRSGGCQRRRASKPRQVSGVEVEDRLVVQFELTAFEGAVQGDGVELADEFRAAAVLQLGNALHRALERGEFELHYQPILDLDAGHLLGFEALLRWQHPERGLLAPLEFIGLAEETGLIVPIGAWALETACTQAAHWQTHQLDGPPLAISVNLSPRQLNEPALPDQVHRILQRSGLQPGTLWLEITETTLMHDTPSVASALRALQAQGIHLAIDDFGTGYSSLSHLKRFPIDALKIDQTFIHGLGRDPDDSAIVTAVIHLAHALGLTCTAEGVETAHQLAELRTLGCEHAQGHLFAHPQPATALTDQPAQHLHHWANLIS